MTKLWIAGGVSIGLVTLLTFLGGQSTDEPVGDFYVYIGILALFMIMAVNGKTWARWIVSPLLLFFGVSALLGGGITGVALAGVFLSSAVVFFRYRPQGT